MKATNIKTDVAVLGGGLAGCSAALAAARNGARVTLIEATGVLGGQAGIGIVTPFGAYCTDKTGKSFGGIVEELFCDIKTLGEKYCSGNDDGIHDSLASAHIVKYLLVKKLSEAGVKIRFHSTFAGCTVRDGRIESIKVLEKSGFCDIFADVFIDASGDGDLLVEAGADYVTGSEPGVFEALSATGLGKRHFSDSEYGGYDKNGVMQPVSIFFVMGGVDYERAAELNNKHLKFGDYGITREKFEAWQFAGTDGFEITDDSIPTPQGRVLVSRAPRSDMAVVNMSRVTGIDGSDTDSLNEGEVRAQLQLIAVVDFLKTFIPGFENSYLVGSGSSLGVRETRRLRGSYILSGLEAINCQRSDEAIARGSYIIDIHDPNGRSAAIGGSLKGDFYDIPYGCLTSKELENLLVCGRCISVDHVAHSSTRIQGTCVMTGQAAGTAAAMCGGRIKDVKEINVGALREKLISDGVYLD